MTVLETPTFEISLNDDASFSGKFLAGFVSQGTGGPCQFEINLPDGSEYQKDPTKRYVKSNVAVGSAPAYSSNPEKKGSEYVEYLFDSPKGSAWRDGWGRQYFSLDLNTSLPLVTSAGISARSIDLMMSCPNKDDQIINEYPSSGFLNVADTAQWPVDHTTNGSVYTILCQDSNIRFWVDHATDAMVLGLGFLLSLLVDVKGQEVHRPAIRGPSRKAHAPTREEDNPAGHGSSAPPEDSS